MSSSAQQQRLEAKQPVSAVLAGRTASAASAAEVEVEVEAPAERYFPVPVVAGHGLFAVVAVVLALLSPLNIGGN